MGRLGRPDRASGLLRRLARRRPILLQPWWRVASDGDKGKPVLGLINLPLSDRGLVRLVDSVNGQRWRPSPRCPLQPNRPQDMQGG